MSDLSDLVEICKNIEKQNNEIIRLLSKISGESNEETEEIEDLEEVINPISALECGEVYFHDTDLFKLSLINNEKTIHNLTGDGESSNFNVAEIVANESVKKDQKIDDATVILTDASKGDLPNALKLCVESGAEKVFIPWNQMTELVSAPQQLQVILNLNFYKNEEDLIEKIFNE